MQGFCFDSSFFFIQVSSLFEENKNLLLTGNLKSAFAVHRSPYSRNVDRLKNNRVLLGGLVRPAIALSTIHSLAGFCDSFLNGVAVVRGWLGPRFPELSSWEGPLGELDGDTLLKVVAEIASMPLRGGPLTQSVPERGES